jgi:N-methylhydantoinase A
MPDTDAATAQHARPGVDTPSDARLGVDVGGTFTDLVLAVGDEVRVAKVPSTPHDQADGILAGLELLGVSPADLARFAHGTTVGTNTVLERDGARVVLVTTAGFADLLVIGRQHRPALYDLAVVRPAPVVARGDVVEVAERLDADGSVVTALTDAEVDRVVARVGDLAPDAVAICLLHAFRDPTHEQRLEAALAPLGIPVSRATALLPTFREVERASTTALNAYVAPRMDRYLTSLERRLDDGGLRAGLMVEVMRSGGGTFAASVAAREPVHTLLSGPAAGAWGGAAIARAVGVEDAVAFDMGGTSTDVTLVRGGRPHTTAEGQIGGLPHAVTTTAIHTVGAGGGSIAWQDDGGALRVGPRSAGAEPGPACYGRGGTAPTVTDADLLLGRLDASTRLGGAMALDVDAARDAVRRLADQLGLSVERTAAGIAAVVEAEMARALRVVSVEQGHDPRELALVAFGGAGGLHQAALAREVGFAHVVVPPSAGVLCATGLLAAPVTTDEARTVLVGLDDADLDALAGTWRELAATAEQALHDQDVDAAHVRWSADLRYRGQAFELEVPVSADAVTVEDLAAGLHDAHRERYGYDQPDTPVEVVTLRVRAEGHRPDVPLPHWTGGGSVDDATVATRRLVVEGDEQDVAVLARDRLAAGAAFDGPAVVTGVESTVWVAPWQTGRVDEVGALHLTVREAAP